ncbi:RNA polymerase sigma factor [Alkalihalobacterium bogoriense]|uniref:RNA polymerase sigma factor n=1 Tax=Alkalihalobacterium bogoriense TaxID=246272 RepID=UPI00047D13F4|nr:RNA polymerase sigma factor [Alkalihalobacterium bogoriense]
MSEDYELMADWYNMHSDSIQSYIYMMVRDYQQSEDLTQETFFKAYKKLHTFHGEASEKTWLFSIAHRTTIDYIRKRKTVFMFKDVSAVDNEGSAGNPETMFVLKEENVELLQALDELKPSQKMVIIMRKIKRFSIKETCEILGWSESKVKSTLHRAILALEAKMKDRGVTYEEITY